MRTGSIRCRTMGPFPFPPNSHKGSLHKIISCIIRLRVTPALLWDPDPFMFALSSFTEMTFCRKVQDIYFRI